MWNIIAKLILDSTIGKILRPLNVMAKYASGGASRVLAESMGRQMIKRKLLTMAIPEEVLDLYDGYKTYKGVNNSSTGLEGLGEPYIWDKTEEPWRSKGRYWIEEHRTPSKGKSSSIPLTKEQIKELQLARVDSVRPHILKNKSGKIVGYRHLDLRIKAKGRITSFAITPKKLSDGAFPGPTERSMGVLQPEHYKVDPTVILSGYGRGVKRVIEDGKCIVWQSAHGNLHLKMEKRRWKRGIAIIRVAPTGRDYFFIPLNARPIHDAPKTKMRLLTYDNPIVERLLKDTNVVASLKKDGARTNITLTRDDVRRDLVRVNLGSYREDKLLGRYFPSARGTRIDYTDKLGGDIYIHDPNYVIVPRGSKRIVLVGEVWSKSRNGATPPVSPKLQGGDFTSMAVPLRPYIYVHGAPEMTPEDEFEYLKMVAKNSGGVFKLPKTRTTEKGKRALLRESKHEFAVDGTVFHDLASGTWYKVKWPEPTEAAITSVQQEHDKLGHPKQSAIPIVKWHGKQFPVAGRLTAAQKRRLYAHPEEYVGGRAKFTYSTLTRNGLPFQPVLVEMEAVL